MSKHSDVLDAAEMLFYRHGFHATGIDRIVAEAGVTPRTLYRHFRSKEALVRAVLARREDRFLTALEQALSATAPEQRCPWAALFLALESWLERENAHGCMFLKALGEYGTRDAVIAEQVVQHKRRVFDLLYQYARRNTDSAGNEQVESLMLLLEGAVALAPVIGSDEALRQASTAARRLLDRPA